MNKSFDTLIFLLLSIFIYTSAVAINIDEVDSTLFAICAGNDNSNFSNLDSVYSLNIHFGNVNNSVDVQKDTLVSDSTNSFKKAQRRKRIVASLFAFPFPFGCVGAHRVMLGSKPWVPIVYVATFGGCFGLLPLIDFCVIVFTKDLQHYENDPNIFMWLKD